MKLTDIFYFCLFTLAIFGLLTLAVDAWDREMTWRESVAATYTGRTK